MGVYMETGVPMRGAMREKVCALLSVCGLDWDDGIDATCALIEDDNVIATGSLDGATIKCVAVDPDHQGEDLTARILTGLRGVAFDRGDTHLMLFTKPKNEPMFSPLGFYPVIRTPDVLLMENVRDGLSSYIASLRTQGFRQETPEKQEIGAIVANCNPITNGHLHLIRTAAEVCDTAHLFILSENKSEIPADDRLRLAREACAGFANVYVHPTDRYMISSATFPAYCLRDAAQVERAYCELDIRIFGEKIAPALRINRRFVGTEPFSPITAFYNAQLKERLPDYGVEVVELPRLEADGEAVSASTVRRLWKEKNFDAIRPLVPDCAYRYLKGE